MWMILLPIFSYSDVLIYLYAVNEYQRWRDKPAQNFRKRILKYSILQKYINCLVYCMQNYFVNVFAK
jgi:hypothetical protein